MPGTRRSEPTYRWDERTRQYHDRITGRFVSREQVRRALDTVIEASQREVDRLAGDLMEGRISLAEWQREMARQMRIIHTYGAASARGGWEQMSQADWGAVGRMTRDQYEYLRQFAQEIEQGYPLNGRFQRRARMYAQAGRGTSEQMRRRAAQQTGADQERRVLGAADHCADCIDWAALGWQPLGTLPRIGQSACRCILSNSPVLTDHGYVPLLDVRIGDLVWTHRQRWRPIVGLVVKPSALHHRAASVNGVWVTEDHLWFGPEGWVSAGDISNLGILLYTMGGGAEYHANMYKVRESDALQATWPVSGVQERNLGVCLRQTQGFSGEDVPVLRMFDQGQAAMVRKPAIHTERASTGRRETAHEVGRCRQSAMADEAGWPTLELVLEGRRCSQEHHLSLPMGLDHGTWADTRRLYHPSQERRQNGRPNRESGTDGSRCSLQVAQCAVQEFASDVDMPTLWATVSGVQTWSATRPEVLLSKVPLRTQTAVFDLIVADDHSFVIGGLFAHNTNCHCHFEFGDDRT